MTLLGRDGNLLSLCQVNNGLYGTYKRISSLIKHSDPSNAVYGQQAQGNSTPNLPVDEERYLTYLNRAANQSRVDYPNLFDISVSIDDSDETIIAKIRSTLSSAQSHLTATIAPPAQWSLLVQSSTASVDLTDALLADENIRKSLIDALRWRSLDIEMKYSHVLDLALDAPETEHQLMLADKKSLYEIAYL